MSSSQRLPLGKVCVACRVWKPFEEFHRKTRSPDGRQSWCRVCNIENQIRVHAENPELCRGRIKKRSDRMRLENKFRVLIHLLKHPCVDCGESDPVVLDFDHLREKRLNVSELANRAVAWDEVAAEMAKCEVVCANCHRRRSGERANSLRAVFMRELRRRSESAG